MCKQERRLGVRSLNSIMRSDDLMIFASEIECTNDRTKGIRVPKIKGKNQILENFKIFLTLARSLASSILAESTITCSKLTIETLEQCVKYFQS